MSTLQLSEPRTAPPGGELTYDKKQALHRLFESVYSDGDLTVARELVDQEFRSHCPGTGEVYHGVSGLKAHASRLRMTFPGLTVEIDELRSTRVGFEARLTAEGRFERSFGDVDPKCVIGPAGEEPGGPTVNVSGVVSVVFAEGHLRHCDFNWDIEGFRDQG